MAFIEQMSVIKFYHMLGKSIEETLNDPQTLYKDDCPSKPTVYYWLRQFKFGRHSVEQWFSNYFYSRPIFINLR